MTNVVVKNIMIPSQKSKNKGYELKEVIALINNEIFLFNE